MHSHPLFRVLAAFILFSPLGYAESHKSNIGRSIVLPSISCAPGVPFAQEGKPLVLEKWATWCKPCIQNFPHLNALYATYGPAGVNFLAVSDEKQDKVFSTLAKRRLTDFPAGVANEGTLGALLLEPFHNSELLWHKDSPRI